jgi:hypothetical protein
MTKHPTKHHTLRTRLGRMGVYTVIADGREFPYDPTTPGDKNEAFREALAHAARVCDAARPQTDSDAAWLELAAAAAAR